MEEPAMETNALKRVERLVAEEHRLYAERSLSDDEAPHRILGCTCVNDVTAVDILNRDASFAQWTRAKSFDTFGVIGPVIATGLDPLQLSVRTILNDRNAGTTRCRTWYSRPQSSSA